MNILITSILLLYAGEIAMEDDSFKRCLYRHPTKPIQITEVIVDKYAVCESTLEIAKKVEPEVKQGTMVHGDSI